MKRIALFAVLAVVVVVGFVMFMQQSEQIPPPETAAEAVAIVQAPDEVPAVDAESDDDAQPEMVE